MPDGFRTPGLQAAAKEAEKAAKLEAKEAERRDKETQKARKDDAKVRQPPRARGTTGGRPAVYPRRSARSGNSRMC